MAAPQVDLATRPRRKSREEQLRANWVVLKTTLRKSSVYTLVNEGVDQQVHEHNLPAIAQVHDTRPSQFAPKTFGQDRYNCSFDSKDPSWIGGYVKGDKPFRKNRKEPSLLWRWLSSGGLM